MARTREQTLSTHPQACQRVRTQRSHRHGHERRKPGDKEGIADGNEEIALVKECAIVLEGHRGRQERPRLEQPRLRHQRRDEHPTNREEQRGQEAPAIARTSAAGRMLTIGLR